MRAIVGESVITCMPPPDDLPENACRNARWSTDTTPRCESKTLSTFIFQNPLMSMWFREQKLKMSRHTQER